MRRTDRFEDQADQEAGAKSSFALEIIDSITPSRSSAAMAMFWNCSRRSPMDFATLERVSSTLARRAARSAARSADGGSDSSGARTTSTPLMTSIGSSTGPSTAARSTTSMVSARVGSGVDEVGGAVRFRGLLRGQTFPEPALVVHQALHDVVVDEWRGCLGPLGVLARAYLVHPSSWSSRREAILRGRRSVLNRPFGHIRQEYANLRTPGCT